MITFINDGKYDQESRSTITLSCSNPLVTILTNNINLNALYVEGEATKSFDVKIDYVPFLTPIEFNVNIKQKFAPYYSWDCSFEILANSAIGIEEAENNENRISVFINSGELYINGIKGNGMVELFDISGKALFKSSCSEPNTNICVNNYKEGIYIVRIIDSNGVQTQKLYIK